MRNIVIVFIAFISMILISSGCKKEKPSVTINGLTFGCKVDGKQFVPDLWDYGYNIPPISIDFVNDALASKRDLFISAEKSNEGVELYINGPLTKGIRNLNTTTISFPNNGRPSDYGNYYVKSPHAEYITSQSIGGVVNLIEVDTLTNRVYGTFEFTGTDKNTGKQVKVTNGVFKNY